MKCAAAYRKSTPNAKRREHEAPLDRKSIARWLAVCTLAAEPTGAFIQRRRPNPSTYSRMVTSPAKIAFYPNHVRWQGVLQKSILGLLQTPKMEQVALDDSLADSASRSAVATKEMRRPCFRSTTAEPAWSDLAASYQRLISLKLVGPLSEPLAKQLAEIEEMLDLREMENSQVAGTLAQYDREMRAFVSLNEKLDMVLDRLKARE